MAAPIANAGVVLSTALHGALTGAGLAWAWLASTEAQAAALEQGTLAGLIIIHPTTPLADDSPIGGAEVATTLTLRCLARSDDAAQALLADAVAALADPTDLTPPAGYAVALQWRAELVLPPGRTNRVAAAQYGATIRRTT